MEPRPSVAERSTPGLPKTWHRDLVFARSLTGATPIGVLWVSRRQNGDRSARCHRLLALSGTRLFVSNGRSGVVSGYNENAHLYDLRSIRYRARDAWELRFRKLILVVDDTVGTQFLTTLWATLGRISAGVPRALLPELDGGARALIDEFESVNGPTEDEDGFVQTYAAACDFFGVRPRASVAAYVRSAAGAAAKRRALRIFDLGACLRESGGGAFRGDDLPAVARALGATAAFDAVAFDGRPTRTAAAAQLSGDGARSVCRAVGLNTSVTRLALVGCGLSASRLEKLEALPFAGLTELNVSENPGLGGRGLARILGERGGGPAALARAELRNVGALRTLPLKAAWGSTLVLLDVSGSDLGRGGSDALAAWLAEATALATLRARRCAGLGTLSVLAALARGPRETLEVLDVSGNRLPAAGDVAPLAAVAAACLRLASIGLREEPRGIPKTGSGYPENSSKVSLRRRIELVSRGFVGTGRFEGSP